jgi:hypothetical protein
MGTFSLSHEFSTSALVIQSVRDISKMRGGAHRRQSWGVGGRDPQILKWGSWGGVVWGVVEGVVSGLLRSKNRI